MRKSIKQRAFSLLTVAATAAMLLVPAYAAVGDSVTAKPAPEVTTVKNAAGEEVAGVLKDANGNEVGSVALDEVTVTPVAKMAEEKIDLANTPLAEVEKELDAELEKELNDPATFAAVDNDPNLTAEEKEAKKEEIREEKKEEVKAKKHLAKAFDDVNKTENLADLSSDFTEVLADVAPEAKAEDMVIRDMFDVSVPKEVKEAMAAGASVALSFQVDVPMDAALVVMHSMAPGEWETIPSDRVQRNADGTVSVTFTSLSPIAFVVDKTEVAPSTDPVVPGDGDSTAPTSPQTGVEVMPMLLAAAVVVAGAAVVMLKKGKNA